MEVKELEKALALEQAKVKLLVNEVIGLEDEIVNRMLGDFDKVVNADSREYWRGQLLENRADATKALESLTQVVGGGAPEVRRPLHNRAQTRPAVRTVTGDVAQGAADAKTAGMVRNRAQEIARSERIPFTVAFRRAEREISGQ